MVFRSRTRRSSKPEFMDSEGSMMNDGVGNRKSLKELRVCADDIGNRTETNAHFGVIRDDIGNSIEAAPTHLLSGVLHSVEGKRRGKRDDFETPQRSGRYLVGGVNPRVSGAAIPLTPKAEVLSEEKAKDLPLPIETRIRRAGPLDGRRGMTEDSAEWGFSRRLKKLFDGDEDDRGAFTLKSDPESKRQVAKDTVDAMWKKAGVKAQIESVLVGENEKASVLVLVQEESEAEQKPLMADEVTFGAVNFIVNKIVNRYPDDRIRLLVIPKSEEGRVREFCDKVLEKTAGKEILPVELAAEAAL